MPWWPYVMPALPQHGHDVPHALSVKAVSLIIRMVPSEWITL